MKIYQAKSISTISPTNILKDILKAFKRVRTLNVSILS